MNWRYFSAATTMVVEASLINCKTGWVGVCERINPFYINYYGENNEYFLTFGISNGIHRLIRFERQDSTVLLKIW